jgi:hypothetical protein
MLLDKGKVFLRHVEFFQGIFGMSRGKTFKYSRVEWAYETKEVFVMKRAVIFIVMGFFWMIELPPSYERGDLFVFPSLGVSKITLGAQDVFYCPYHPEKPYDAPGRCPKCGRTLQKKQTEMKKETPKEHGPHHDDAPCTEC